MNRQLLIETNLFEGKIQENDNGVLLVKGILQRCGARNQNGRVYPRPILEREVNKYKQLITERRALGELDHPDASVINLKNVSHNIREIYWDGDDVMGVLEILPTPSGNILKELLRSNILLGISSRGMGSVKQIEEGGVEVQEDFELICFDMVSNPSTHGAFMTPMKETVLSEGFINEFTSDKCGDFCRAQHLMQEIMLELNDTEFGE